MLMNAVDGNDGVARPRVRMARIMVLDEVTSSCAAAADRVADDIAAQLAG